MLSRILSCRINQEIDNKITDIAIRLRVTKGEVVRHAIERLYEDIHDGRHERSTGAGRKGQRKGQSRNEHHERPHSDGGN